jgi:hypothetical protein
VGGIYVGKKAVSCRPGFRCHPLIVPHNEKMFFDGIFEELGGEGGGTIKQIE